MKKIILTIILIFLTTLSYAQTDWQRFRYFDASGGLNNKVSPILIKDNEASDLQNVIFDTTGEIDTRNGFAKLNSASVGDSTSCTGVKYYELSNGNQYLVAVFDDGTIQKMDYSGGPDGTWDDITGALSFSNGVNIPASFTVGEDTLIIEDGIGTTAPYKWTSSGNAAALGGSPPNATIVTYHKNMAFAAGNSTSPSTLYFSDVGDIENWTTGLSGNIDIENNDGSIIRGLIPGFDGLYIFKDTSIWRLSGDDKDNFVLQRMIPDLGTLSNQSLTRLGSDIIFVSSQGDVFIYDGSIGVRKISSKVDGTIDAANFSRFAYAKGIIFRDDFYASISSSAATTHDTVLYFDTFLNAWSKFDGMNVNCWDVADDGSGQDILVFGDYTGFVYDYPNGTDDAGTAISSYFTTKQYIFNEMPNSLKDLRFIDVFANVKGDYDLTIDVMIDFQSSGSEYNINLNGGGDLWDSSMWDQAVYGGEGIIIDNIQPDIEGRFFQLKFSNSNSSQPIGIKGWDIYVEKADRI